MDPTRTLPSHLIQAAKEYADGTRTPAEPRAASTVVLLREGDGLPGGLEVYLLRRHVSMEFAPGMRVFPGGGVDPRDAELAPELWAGPTADGVGSPDGLHRGRGDRARLRGRARDVRGVRRPPRRHR